MDKVKLNNQNEGIERMLIELLYGIKNGSILIGESTRQFNSYDDENNITIQYFEKKR